MHQPSSRPIGAPAPLSPVRRALASIFSVLREFGFDPIKTVLALRALPGYARDLWGLSRQRRSARDGFRFGRLDPCLEDKYAESGSARGAYFHQDLLVARRIFARHPAVHIDVGSSISGFVAHVASFRPIEVIDLRPNRAKIPNVTFTQADLMAPLPAGLVDACDSLSCLHAMEHFGLGRYGDSINVDGHLLGIANLHRLLKPNGKLYFSVPIGPQRIEFNAHRIFSVGYLLDLFRDRYRLDQFSFIDDRGDLHENISLTPELIATNCGCFLGCGVLEMTKLSPAESSGDDAIPVSDPH